MDQTAEIRARIRELLLAENSNAEIEEEEDYTAAFADLGIDSLDLMMATLRISEVYEFEFKEGDFSEIETIDDLVNYVKAHLAST